MDLYRLVMTQKLITTTEKKLIHDMQLNLILVSFKQSEIVFYMKTNHFKFTYIHMYKQTNILRDHISKITLKKRSKFGVRLLIIT